MKKVRKTWLAGVAALALAALAGCEGDSDGESKARPADISGRWVGYSTGASTKYPVILTLTQNGTRVSGTYVKGRSSFMNPQPDTRLDVSGTYDPATGIFNCNGWWTITFIDDNTMTWRTGSSWRDKYTTILHRQ